MALLPSNNRRKSLDPVASPNYSEPAKMSGLNRQVDWVKLSTSLLATGISSVVVYFLMKSLTKQMDPSYEKKEKAMIRVSHRSVLSPQLRKLDCLYQGKRSYEASQEERYF